MEALPLEQQDKLADLFRIVGQEVDAGVVDASHHERIRYWNYWKQHIGQWPHLDPMLTNASDEQRIELLTTYAKRVREGDFTKKGNRVRAQSVQVALRAVGSTCELAGKPNPTYRSEGRYWLKVERLLESYRRIDPPPQAKMAVPVKVVKHILTVNRARNTNKSQALGDMCLIAFYFLLRVGEYTYHKDKRRTTQFRAMDVTFFDQDKSVIPSTSPLEVLLAADSVTMTIDNQKNGVRKGMIHHDALHHDECPVRALARRVHSIMSHPKGDPSHIISTYYDEAGIGRPLKNGDINIAIKDAVVAQGLTKKGFSRSSVSSHSLRAGGAMAMHLNGVKRDTIRKMGHWSSDTFLMYIHEQISAFSSGISKKMQKEIGWHNVEGLAPSLIDEEEEDAVNV